MVLGGFLFFRMCLDEADALAHHMGMTTMQYSGLKFVTPPSYKGQIIERSYAVDADREEIVCRGHDASDGTTSYAVTPLSNLLGEFEPWNRVPSLRDDGLWEAVS